MPRRRILVTGGAGLVGSHAAEYYALKDEEVIVLDNLMRSNLFSYDKQSVEYNWNYLSKYKNITRIKGDVRKEEDVKRAIGKKVDVVIHAAGQPGVPLSVRIPKQDFSINAFGTLNVLECLRERSQNATFIYCSTNKVYGENVSQIPIIEKDKRYVYDGPAGVSETMSIDYTGHTPYGVSKYVGDIYTQEYSRTYGMRTAVFRMSCTYGTRQFGFEDQGWVSWFVIAVIIGKPITIYGNGKQVRDLLYVSDLIEGFDKFIDSRLNHAVFNIGGGPNNTLSLLEFLERITRLTGRTTELRFSQWRPSDQKVYISDITGIKKSLNWQPEVKTDEGIRRIIEWIEGNRSYFQKNAQ